MVEERTGLLKKKKERKLGSLLSSAVREFVCYLKLVKVSNCSRRRPPCRERREGLCDLLTFKIQIR